MTQVPTTTQAQTAPRPDQAQPSPAQVERGASEKFTEAVHKRQPKPMGEKDVKEGFGRGEGKGESSPTGQDSLFSVLGRLSGQGKREPGERGDGLPGHDGPGRETLAGDTPGRALPGAEALLAALGGQPTRGPEGVTARHELDPVLTNKLVDRILVSAPDAGGPAEVRISLRDDALPGTEVRIQRLADGGVRVQFVTENPQAERLLGQNQLNGLQQALGESLRAEVRVSTIRSDGSLSSEADGGGQQEQGGGQGQEGDSRRRSSQYDLYQSDNV